MKTLALTRFKGNPVTGTLMAMVCFGSVLNGMQWGPVQLFEIDTAFASMSWGVLLGMIALPFYFHTAGEIVLGTAVALACCVPLEQQWGARKFLRYLCSCHFVGWTLRIVAFHTRQANSTVLPGCYFMLFGALYAYVAVSPKSVLFVAYGLPYNSCSCAVLLGAQLALVHWNESLVMAVCGLGAGLCCSSTAYELLPSFPKVCFLGGFFNEM